jgi:hypothetical protein
MKESDIQKTIMDYLRLKNCLVFKHRNVGIYKQSTGKYIPLSYGEKGISDIIGLTDTGRFIAVEVKMPKKKPSKEQQEFIDNVVIRGGIAFVAHSLDEVIENENL